MSSANRFSVNFTAPIWLWQGKGTRHFVTLPLQAAEQLREIDSISLNTLAGKVCRGWGSMPVQAKLGKSVWDTSLFPDKQSGSYFLPMKATIRKAETIAANDLVTRALSIPMP